MCRRNNTKLIKTKTRHEKYMNDDTRKNLIDDFINDISQALIPADVSEETKRIAKYLCKINGNDPNELVVFDNGYKLRIPHLSYAKIDLYSLRLSWVKFVPQAMQIEAYFNALGTPLEKDICG